MLLEFQLDFGKGQVESTPFTHSRTFASSLCRLSSPQAEPVSQKDLEDCNVGPLLSPQAIPGLTVLCWIPRLPYGTPGARIAIWKDATADGNPTAVRVFFLHFSFFFFSFFSSFFFFLGHLRSPGERGSALHG